MTKKSFKEELNRADERIKKSLKRKLNKTHIILIIIFLSCCGLFSLYQVVSSFYKMKPDNTQIEISQPESSLPLEDDISTSTNQREIYNYGTAEEQYGEQ